MKRLLVAAALLAPLSSASAEPVTAADCGFRKMCFFNAKGDLLYWITEYHHRNPATGAIKNFYITAYTSIQNKQEEFNDWVDEVYPGSTQIKVLPSGRLNIPTLRIPVKRAYIRSELIYRSFMLDCHRGVMEKITQGEQDTEAMRQTCEMTIQQYAEAAGPGQGRSAILFPDETLRSRAETIRAGWVAAQAFDALIEQLVPLTEEWNNYNDWDWLRLGETGHIEMNQIPSGFMEKLSDTESLMNFKVEYAEKMEGLYRTRSP